MILSQMIEKGQFRPGACCVFLGKVPFDIPARSSGKYNNPHVDNYWVQCEVYYPLDKPIGMNPS
jgi:hypothetical protein